MAEDIKKELEKAMDRLKPQPEDASEVRTLEKEKVKKANKGPNKKEKQVMELAESIEVPENYRLINTPELLDKLIQHYKMYKRMWNKSKPYTFIDTETYGLNPFKDEIVSISLGFMDNNHFHIPLRPFKHDMSKHLPTLTLDQVVSALKPFFEADKLLVLANSKFDIHVLYNWCNIDITFNIHWDTVIAGGLLNENHLKGLKEWYKGYALPDLIKRGIIKDETKLPTFKFGSMFDKIPFDQIPHKLAIYYACHDTFMTKAVFEFQKSVMYDPLFQLDRIQKLFWEVEMPLIAVLATAERRGIAVDGDFLSKDIGDALKKKLQEITQEIYSHLGEEIVLEKTKNRTKNKIKYKEPYTAIEPFKLSSPKQLAQKLYVDHRILEEVMEYDKKLKKKVPKKKTDKKTLQANENTHPVIKYILEYRGLSKLIEAFCDKLPLQAQGTKDGKVHCSYNQLVRTGRMSCKEPNLQQVPSKFDLIRYAFRADEGRLLASLDFSQQELRWLAILTQDPALLEVYTKGLDMHSRITCQIYGFDYDMFEQIRNFEGDSEKETSDNIEKIKAKWQGTSEINHAFTVAGVAVGDLAELVPKLASTFESKRKSTKSVVFGTVYGITEIGLAAQINGTKEEAKKLIDSFKASLPGYLAWEAEVHRKVMEDTYVETVLGRKRRFGETISEAKSSDLYKKRNWHYLLEKVKRQATNTGIQGTSADQVKKAMVDLFYPTRPDGTRCFDRLEWLTNNYKSVLEVHDIHLLLQVHDELVFDIPENVEYSALKELAQVMQNAIPTEHLGVTFKSDIEVSPYWGGKFSPEQVGKIASGELDWKVIFAEEVETKMEKQLGYEYELGMFKEEDEDDDSNDTAA